MEQQKDRQEPRPQHILSLSYGKDSMACLFAIEQLGWPLDRIITADIWATQTIPADLPPMVEFKAKADAAIKCRWGIDVEHFCAMRNGKRLAFEDEFYRRRQSSKNGNTIHQMYGWPFRNGAWCNDRLKIKALNQTKKNCAGAIQYIGIAADEPERIARHQGRPDVKLPLVEVGWDEATCRKICEDNGLLSPIYVSATRGGCWFCHNQGTDQLRQLRHEYPELWAYMMKWDADSPVIFKANGQSVHDFERRFALEDEGLLIPGDPKFKWAMLDGPIQLRLF